MRRVYLAFSCPHDPALDAPAAPEVEPYPGQVWLARQAIVDLSEWQHPLPKEVK